MAETNNLQVMIHDFHTAFGHPSFPFSCVVKGLKDWSIIGNEVNSAHLANQDIANLRYNLLIEEIREGQAASDEIYTNPNALARDSFIEIVDAIGDILVLTLGTGCVYNLVLDCPSYDITDECEKLSSEATNIGLVFSFIFEQVEDLNHYLLLATTNPKRAILQAASVSRCLQNIVNLCFAHAAVFGYNLNEVLREIHRSNMSKLGEDGRPIYREDGKILKGPNYFKPDLTTVLDKADAVFPV